MQTALRSPSLRALPSSISLIRHAPVLCRLGLGHRRHISSSRDVALSATRDLGVLER